MLWEREGRLSARGASSHTDQGELEDRTASAAIGRGEDIQHRTSSPCPCEPRLICNGEGYETLFDSGLAIVPALCQTALSVNITVNKSTRICKLPISQF